MDLQTVVDETRLSNEVAKKVINVWIENSVTSTNGSNMRNQINIKKRIKQKKFMESCWSSIMRTLNWRKNNHHHLSPYLNLVVCTRWRGEPALSKVAEYENE